jgi:competence protein ComEC
MYVLKHVPLLKYLIFFIAGILLEVNTEIPFLSFYFVSALFLVGVILLHYVLKKKTSIRLLRLSSILLLLLVSVLSFSISKFKNHQNSNIHFSKFPNYASLLGKVISKPQEKPNSLAFEFALQQIKVEGSWKPCIGKIQIYGEIDSKSRALDYGDVLIINYKFSSIEGPRNPNQFNFKRYNKYKNIFNSGYLPASNWVRIAQNKGNRVIEFGYKVQHQLLQHFKRYFKNESVKGLAQAVVFGYKEDLNKDWMKSFSQSGTIHVLAVSGLHVGIIFILLSTILRLSKSTGRVLIFKSVLIIIVLFGYSLVTGFSPSVTRSGLMFSLLLIGKAFSKRAVTFNTLSFACIILLLISPNDLFNLGFQFSFLAVLGILLYAEPIQKRLTSSSWLLNKITTLLSVSLAAQITTFPLALYYFNQFPNLFLVSNLIVIPYITMVLYAGVAFITLGLISEAFAGFISHLISGYIEFIIIVVSTVQKLPFALTDNVHLSLTQLFLLYGIVITTSLAFYFRKVQYLFSVVILVFGITVLVVSKSIKANRNEMIVFHSSNSVLLGFKQGKQLIVVVSDNLLSNNNFIDYTIKPYCIQERIESLKILPNCILKRKADFGSLKLYGNGMFWFDNRRCLFIDLTNDKEYINISFDYVLVSEKNNQIDFTILDKTVDFEHGILLNQKSSLEEARGSQKWQSNYNGSVIIPR